eukprot:Pompholyxophrys_punicea_v1_NODE_270_length_2442_cov_14.718894.p1 type:complete len:145 gc:universal NODE_270_length_2442_cov_14.718894:1192-758(-)
MRYNLDQSPLPFVLCLNDTYDDIGAEEVWLNQPNQATLQLCFRPRGVQPRPSLIFRGTGTRISAKEKVSYSPRVDVYFQPKAWADRNLSEAWKNNTWARHCRDVPMAERLLLCDNLDSQTYEPCRENMKDKYQHNSLVRTSRKN